MIQSIALSFSIAPSTRKVLYRKRKISEQNQLLGPHSAVLQYSIQYSRTDRIFLSPREFHRATEAG